MLNPRIIYRICLLAAIAVSCSKFPGTKVCGTGIAGIAKDTFALYYNYAGLGFGFGHWYPVFRVKGTKYLYTYEQNSYDTEPDPRVDTVCTGFFRQSSIDSIIALVRPVKDTLIYETNIGVMSGGVHNINIRTKSGIDLSFNLHNASHPLAQKIVDILNTNIPADKDPLWLFNLPKDEDLIEIH